MSIVLVSIHPYPSPQAIPLACAFLKAAASGAAVDIRLVDLFVGDDVDRCVARLVELQPSAIGFSIYTWNRSLCQEIASGLRKKLPTATLFAGGPEVTADPHGFPTVGGFDFLILGEGESPFAAVCSRLAAGEPVAGIPGVAIPGGTGSAAPPPCADLDSIPSPWLNGTLDVAAYRGILWQLSRGCGFSCDFCFDSRDGGGVRRFSMDRIEAELALFVGHDVSQIFVLDSTFNQDPRRAKAILKLIRTRAPYIHFHFEVRSEFIDREMAGLFAGITCSLQIGLQSSDPAVLAGVGRAFNRDDFIARIGLLNAAGAIFGFDLMYGLPGDTYPGFCASLDFALGLYPNHLDIFPLVVLPGTSLAARSAALGLRHLPDPPYTLISSPTFSSDAMVLSQSLANACDIFYTRGRAVAWFNSVVVSLRLTPSELLRQFASWLAVERGPAVREIDLGDREIWQMQRQFLTSRYDTRKLKRFVPLILDLVDYHYHYAIALSLPLPEPPEDHELERIQLLDDPSRLSPSTRLVTFHYEILDVLEVGEPGIKGFSDQYPAAGSFAAIYPAPDGVRTESLIEPYYRILEQLDGRTAPRVLARKLRIDPEEALSFLEFAAVEGIIELSGQGLTKNG